MGAKSIYDHMRKKSGVNAQVQLNSIYKMRHRLEADINIPCALSMNTDMFKFLSRIRNFGSLSESYHARYTNFGDSTLICSSKYNDIDYGKLNFTGNKFLYAVNSDDEKFENTFELERS